MKDDDNNKNREKSNPGLSASIFRNYLEISIVTAIIFFLLDIPYRFGLILKYYDAITIIINGAFMVLFCCAIAVFFAAIIFMIQLTWDSASRLIHDRTRKSSGNGDSSKNEENDRAKKSSGSIASFLFYSFFAYAMSLYYKFVLIANNHRFDVVVEQENLKSVIVFAVLILIYFPLQKKLTFEAISKFAKFYIKPAGFIILLAALIAITGYISDFNKTQISSPRESISTNKKLPSIIFISFDSLNTFHMSLYGYPRKTTPRLDEFAKESFVFDHMKSNSDSTEYSLPCILGKYNRQGMPYDKIDLPTFASELGDLGYRQRVFISFKNISTTSAGFTERCILTRFDQTSLARTLFRGNNEKNFRWLSAFVSQDKRFFYLLAQKDPRDFGGAEFQPYATELTFERIVKTLKDGTGPSFVWAHIWEPHNPYIVPQPYLTRFGRTIIDLYDGSILYLDSSFGNLVDTLKKEGLYDNAIIVVTSDHGEAHAEENHAGLVTVFHISDWLNESVTSIPLLIHLPSQKIRKNPHTFAEHVDLAPTIISLIGEKVPQWMEGESLIPYMQDENSLSKKIKICVPYAYFARNEKYLDKKPALWAFGNAEIINAFCYRYKFCWLQTYTANPGNKKFINQPESVIYYGIYDMFQDPAKRGNFVHEKSFDGAMQELFNSDLASLYRSKTIKRWSRIKGNDLREYIKKQDLK